MRRGTCAMSPWEGDVHSDEGRTRRSRDRAAQAYAFLLDAAGDHWRDMVLIGGLVPDTLVDTEEPHQGTLDVDVLLPLALQYDRDDEDFAWLESALVDAGFVRTHENTGWRWVNDVDGFPVIVEFLVDVPDAQGQEIPLPGADRLGAMNVAGPGPALHDARVVQFAGREAKVAGIGGTWLRRPLPSSVEDEAKICTTSPTSWSTAVGRCGNSQRRSQRRRSPVPCGAGIRATMCEPRSEPARGRTRWVLVRTLPKRCQPARKSRSMISRRMLRQPRPRSRQPSRLGSLLRERDSDGRSASRPRPSRRVHSAAPGDPAEAFRRHPQRTGGSGSVRKPMILCVPSQNGLSVDLPQRQRATVRRSWGIVSPSGPVMRKFPRTRNGPFG